MSPAEARSIIDRFAYLGVLTLRQQQVIALLAEGKSVTEAAAELGIATNTAVGHVNRAGLNIRVHEQRKKRRR